MSDPQPPPPPLPRSDLLMKRCKLLWRLLLVSNFALGAYLFARAKRKDIMELEARTVQRLQKEKEKEKEKEKAIVEVPPEPIISSLDPMYDDSIYDDKLLFVPGELRGPVPDEQQRELFEWLLEEKRKLKPKDNVEKKKIDEEKAILKRFLRAESIPKL